MRSEGARGRSWGLTESSSPVPGLPQVKPLHSHSRYLHLCPCVPAAECRPPSAFPLTCLTPSLLPRCLSPIVWLVWNLATSLCLSLCSCLPDVLSASVVPSAICLSLRWCMQEGRQARSCQVWTVPLGLGAPWVPLAVFGPSRSCVHSSGRLVP